VRVAISGVSGLIGSALAEGLRSDGHEVLGISRRPGADRIVWDVEAGLLDPAALEGVDAVVHLAGESIQGRWTAAKKQRILRSRVDSTELLVSAVARLDRPPGVVVSGSAMGYYGDRGDELLDESAARGVGFLADVTAAWEDAALPIADLGVRLCLARTSIVLAAEGGAFPRIRALTRAGLGGPLASGRQFWSWITLADEIAALRFLIESDVEGPVNLATSDPVRQRDFAKELASALRRPAVVPAPAFAIRGALGEMGKALLLDSTRLEPRVLGEVGFSFGSPSLGAALDKLLRD
jgi:uncharacterized protein (TIGR01777 family)